MLRLRGASWAEVAEQCGYANAGCAYGTVVYRYADDDDERERLITPPWREELLLERWGRRAMRDDEAARTRGLRTGSFQCLSCRRFKSLPSARCDYCGDDPVTHNGDPRDFDRAYGYG